MRYRSLLMTVLTILALGTARAEETTLTVSTNNTPLDRKVLQEVSSEAFKRIGYRFKMVSLPSERSLYAANLAEVDGEGLRVAGLTDQYPNLIQVPERYVGISFVAFAKDPSINLAQGWDSLKSYRVAFITGWKMFEAKAAGARSVTRVNTPEQLFQMLDSGRVDLALYTLADGKLMTRRLGLPAVAPLTPALADVDMYLYLNWKHQDLVPKLTQALVKMKADGTYDRILSSLTKD